MQAEAWLPAGVRAAGSAHGRHASTSSRCGVRRVGGLDRTAPRRDAAEAEARGLRQRWRAAPSRAVGWSAIATPTAHAVLRPASLPRHLHPAAGAHPPAPSWSARSSGRACRTASRPASWSWPPRRCATCWPACARSRTRPTRWRWSRRCARRPTPAPTSTCCAGSRAAAGSITSTPATDPDGPVKDALASLAEFHARRLLLSPAGADRGVHRPTACWSPPRSARRDRARPGDACATSSRAREPSPRPAATRCARSSTGSKACSAPRCAIPRSGSAESDEDAMHIQTIHGAKGLEYPIVLLGGLGSGGRGRFAGVDVIADRRTGRLACSAGWGWQTGDYAAAQAREQQMADAEAVRLLYVATTRARDHLVLSLFRGDKCRRLRREHHRTTSRGWRTRALRRAAVPEFPTHA